MAIVEEYFPRGGKAKAAKKSEAPANQKKKARKTDTLFKSAPLKKRKKQLKVKKQNNSDSDDDSDEDLIQEPTPKKGKKAEEKTKKEKATFQSIEPPTYKMLTEGMHLLSRVQEVREMDVLLSLPGRIQAVVPITNLSTPYSSLLNRLAQDEELDVQSLQGMLTEGQIYPCSIKEVTTDGSFKVTASLNPADLCSDIPLTALCKGMKMTAAVVSVEDHGYVMDVGIANVRSFLAKQKSLKLAAGQIVNVYVTGCQVDGHVANLTLSTKETIKFKQNVELNIVTILPGTKLHVNVKKVTPQGLIVNFGNLVGYIHKDHLADATDDLSAYTVNTNLVAVALYTVPLVNAVYLTLKTSLVAPENATETKKLDIGKILDAQIAETTTAGVFLQLNKNVKGFVPLRHLSDNQDHIEDVKAFFPVKARKRCRILAYAALDETYICTLKKSLLQQKVLRYEDFAVGDLVEAKVESVTPAGITVNLGINLRGFIPKLHWADDPRLKRPELRFAVGTKISCRVLKVLPERKTVHLTCKKSLVGDAGPYYDDASELREGINIKGTVALVEKGGILVAFYGELTGWMPRDKLTKLDITDINRYFYIGQLVNCVVDDVQESGKVTLNLVKSGAASRKQQQEAAVEVVEGQQMGAIVPCRVERVVSEGSSCGLEVSMTTIKSKAFIPVEHLSDFPETCPHLLKCFRAGDTIDEAVVWLPSKLQMVLSLKPSIVHFARDKRFPSSIDEIVANSVFPCVSARHRDFGVFATLLCPPTKCDVLIPVSKMSAGLFASIRRHKDAAQSISMEGKVLSVNREEKKVSVSALDSDLPQHAAELLEAFFHEQERMRRYMLSSSDERLKSLASLKLGDTVMGNVDKQFDPAADLEFELTHGLKAIVPVHHHVNKKFNKDDLIVGSVLYSDLLRQVVYVTTRNDVISHLAGVKNSGAPKGQRLQGKILLNTDYFSLVSVDHGDVAFVSNIRTMNEAAAPPRAPHKAGTQIAVVISGQSSQKVATYCGKRKGPAADSSPSKKTKLADEKKVASEEPVAVKKTGKQKAEERAQTGKTIEDAKKKKKKDKKTVEVMTQGSEELPRLPVTAAFKWDDNMTSLPATVPHSSDSDEEEEEAQVDKVTVKDRKERVRLRLEKARQEEAKLTKIEDDLNNPIRAPASADDFDRMVLSSPNSSILWLQYMALHLENADIERARAIAKRALKIINFREEQEKFNVWLGLLNLEHMYGTSDMYEETLQEAIRYNEPLKVYRQLALNFEQSGKFEEAEALHETMLKKHKRDKSVWINACLFYAKNSKLDTARSILQRALAALDKKDHIDLISRFAQLEVKCGQTERGKALFDTLMLSYPKRTDLWLVYVDTLTKAGDVESARVVLERCITLQLPAKKMKTMFQKFLEFETHHGDADRQNYVRQKALDYVESKTTATTEDE